MAQLEPYLKGSCGDAIKIKYVQSHSVYSTFEWLLEYHYSGQRPIGNFYQRFNERTRPNLPALFIP